MTRLISYLEWPEGYSRNELKIDLFHVMELNIMEEQEEEIIVVDHLH